MLKSPIFRSTPLLQVRRKAPASYTKVVLRGMAHPEAIVKLVMAPVQPSAAAYAEQYVRMLPASTAAEFGRVLEMKGVVRRAEQAPLVEAWRRVQQLQLAAVERQQLNRSQLEPTADNDDDHDGRGSAAMAMLASMALAPERAQPAVAATAEMGHMRKLEALIKKRLP